MDTNHDVHGQEIDGQPADVARVEAKLRYRSPSVGAAVGAGAGGFELALDEPVYGVARGQAAVLYDGDAVVGCGLVSSASDQ